MTHSNNERLIVVGAAILLDGRCLIGKRPLDRPQPGLWEFPGGKVEEGESPEAALVREIDEELAVAIEVHSFIGRGMARAGTRPLQLDVYEARLLDPRAIPHPHEHTELRWVRADELDDFEWATPDIPIVPQLRRLLLEKPTPITIPQPGTAAGS